MDNTRRFVGRLRFLYVLFHARCSVARLTARVTDLAVPSGSPLARQRTDESTMTTTTTTTTTTISRFHEISFLARNYRVLIMIAFVSCDRVSNEIGVCTYRRNHLTDAHTNKQ